jgi:hypothetical protein
MSDAMIDKSREVNAQLAAIRSAPHNGKMYQADDADYMLALAEFAGGGLGAISPQWFRDQAKLIRGTLAQLALAEAVAEAAKKYRAAEVRCNHTGYGALNVGATGGELDAAMAAWKSEQEKS